MLTSTRWPHPSGLGDRELTPEAMHRSHGSPFTVRYPVPPRSLLECCGVKARSPHSRARLPDLNKSQHCHSIPQNPCLCFLLYK